MSRYRLGAEAEMRIVQILRDEGWQVIGSAGSKSPFDVVAMGPAGRIAVQVSRSSGPTKSSTKELEEVQEDFAERSNPVCGEIAPTLMCGGHAVQGAGHEAENDLPVQFSVPRHDGGSMRVGGPQQKGKNLE